MKRDDVLRILAEHRAELEEMGVRHLDIFGSVARDEAGPESDVDVLVEFSKPVGLFEYADIKEYLERLLGCPVDMATRSALRKEMRDTILKEAIPAG